MKTLTMAGSILVLAGAVLFPALSASGVAQGADSSTVTDGSGPLVERDYRIGNARSVKLQLPLDLTVRVGSAPSLTISTQDNIHPFLKIETHDGILLISSEGSYRSYGRMTGVLTLPQLDSVHVQGSGDIAVDSLSARDFTVSVQGSGDVVVNGRADRVRAQVEGSGDIDLTRASVSSVDAMVEGSGDVMTGSVAELTAAVHGSGDIVYGGNPRIVSRAVHGSGDIRRR